MATGTILSVDEKVERIARGREATIVAGLLRPLIDDRIERTLQMLIRNYRTDEVTHDQLVGGIAEISALRGLMSELERTHKQAVGILESEHAKS